MKTIAVITARGGSKRIPKKNITEVAGRPLVEWSIDAALRSNVCDRIVVSTDHEEIARIAVAAGAECPFLRLNAADDHATASQAVLATLDQAEQYWEESYQRIVLLMPTCPLRTCIQVRAQMEEFISLGCDYLLSCAGFGPTKPWWAFVKKPNNEHEFLHPEALKTRSQELPQIFAPSGATWIANVDALRSSGTFYGPGHRFHEIPWISAIDIDEPEDIVFVEKILASGHHSSPFGS
jgi:CMP-N-acetylneuraminic acid synthetase